MLKTALAVTLGKLSAQVIQTCGLGSGTSLPGKVGLKVDRNLLQQLGKQVRKQTIAVTGTNGKSTTSGLISAFIQHSNGPVVHNHLGANMDAGITAALINQSSFSGKLNGNYGVFEMDEACMPSISQSIKQDVTVVTNLFRDQLDRYGELDTTASFIQKGITISGGQLILNADDPMVCAIGTNFPQEQVTYYGVSTLHYPHHIDTDFPVPFPKEVTDCPLCQATLNYSQFTYGHLGHYACSQCDFKRPVPNLIATDVQLQPDGSQLTLSWQGNTLSSLSIDIPGVFNAYNLLAAVTVAQKLDLPTETLQDSLDHYQSIFGRAEKRVLEGKNTLISLIKNPIGAAEVLKMVAMDPHGRVLIIINDDYADGRDISWLWDAPFELLRHNNKPITVSGTRATDMALRLHYAGVENALIHCEPNLFESLDYSLEKTSAEETLHILPTYTALLKLSKTLGSR